MNLEVLGPRAVGKTTLCEHIASHYDVEYVSLGRLSRQEMAAGSPMGIKMKYHVENGILYPEGFLYDFLSGRLEAALVRSNGFVLDGYPRRKSEALELMHILGDLDSALDACIELDASVDELVRRSTDRFWCSSCDLQLSVDNQTEIVPNCPNCGIDMGKRSDDSEDEIVRMHEMYLDSSEEVKAVLLAEETTKLLIIDADNELPFVVQSALYFIGQLASN